MSFGGGFFGGGTKTTTKKTTTTSLGGQQQAADSTILSALQLGEDAQVNVLDGGATKRALDAAEANTQQVLGLAGGVTEASGKSLELSLDFARGASGDALELARVNTERAFAFGSAAAERTDSVFDKALDAISEAFGASTQAQRSATTFLGEAYERGRALDGDVDQAQLARWGLVIAVLGVVATVYLARAR